VVRKKKCRHAGANSKWRSCSGRPTRPRAPVQLRKAQHTGRNSKVTGSSGNPDHAGHAGPALTHLTPPPDAAEVRCGGSHTPAAHESIKREGRVLPTVNYSKIASFYVHCNYAESLPCDPSSLIMLPPSSSY
jgi:hypothetical protein